MQCYSFTEVINQNTNLNTFGSLVLKTEWIKEFFQKPDTFFIENTLGGSQFRTFKSFLRRAGLMETETEKTTTLFKAVQKIGWDEVTTWGLMLVNLTYNAPQFRWYLENLPPEIEVPRNTAEKDLQKLGVSIRNTKEITRAFKHFCKLPLGTELKFGSFTVDSQNRIATLKRTKPKIEDSRVVLYALYKFAEAYKGCWYQVSLSQLLNADKNSAGVSPTKIFCIEREEMRHFLNEISAKYSEYVSATFTFDLEKVSLASNKTSQDVLILLEQR